MKKFISVVLFGAMAYCMFGVSVEKPAEAQVLYGAYCCDNSGWRRCMLDFPAPVGNTCFCRGQGYGWTCS